MMGALNDEEIKRAGLRGMDPPPRKIQVIEVCVFLLLVLPSAAVAPSVLKKGDLHFTAIAVSSIVNDLAQLSLILYFVWRNGEGLRSIGLSLRRWWVEVLLGCVLYFPFVFVVGLVQRLVRVLGFATLAGQPRFLTPRGMNQVLLALALVVVVAVVEEIVFRGYLILRFRTAFGGRAGAVMMSALVFTAGHGYEGAGGMMAVGVIGLIFALLYVWRGSLLVPMVLHFLQDFVSIVLMPLAKSGGS